MLQKILNILKIEKPGNFIEKIGNFIENKIKPIFTTLLYLRVPLTIALFSLLLFVFVDQTLDIYRSIALENDIDKATISTLFVTILSILVWYSGRLLEYKKKTKNQLWLRRLPRLLGAVPLASLSLGIVRANSAAPNFFLNCWFIICCIATIMVFLFFINRRNLFKSENALGFLKLNNVLAVEDDNQGLFSDRFENIFVNVAYILFSGFSLPIIASNSKTSIGVIAIFILGILVNGILLLWHREQKLDILILYLISLAANFIFLFKMPTVALVNNIGTVSIVAISLSVMVVVFATIYHWGIENKIPALTAIILLLLISSLLNLNDNHQIRQLATKANRELPTLETSFDKWLASREDFEKYREQDKPYPVYLVSAQGGGIFAAYHASTALSKLHDSLPNFSQHIFAISSVSGGSLGASAFSSLVKENIDNQEPLEKKAIKLFGQDLLSPLLSMGLFPDLLQRFLPFSINTWDRAIGLEIAFEKAWEQTYINETEEKQPSKDYENPLKKSYYDHWKPESIAPALVLNTTEVETGERLRITPFKIPLPQGAENVFEEGNIDFRLSTAAGLSARFPIFTPVGWYEKKDNQLKSRLADGGYFDNSGVSTALDIGGTLEKIEGFEKKFDVIHLSFIDLPNQSLPNEMNNQGLNEIGSPIRALFNVRTARSKSIVQQAQDLLNKDISNPLEYKFRNLYLDKQPNKVKLPLGWFLSKYSQKEINKQNTTAKECNEETFKNESNQSDNKLNVANHNACVAKSIADDLTLKVL